ncbi:hypothetical protein EVAR_96662_1 [Eumeta japonica]|uniref:Uncharacterized protein n=1 Tax=Eumeta variegata TaxID=151549 RepID=A0A4C1WG63_EUMVA|nr:hypothetical protein EVAR_96662_1 [Eumeta japonica]
MLRMHTYFLVRSRSACVNSVLRSTQKYSGRPQTVRGDLGAAEAAEAAGRNPHSSIKTSRSGRTADAVARLTCEFSLPAAARLGRSFCFDIAACGVRRGVRPAASAGRARPPIPAQLRDSL